MIFLIHKNSWFSNFHRFLCKFVFLSAYCIHYNKSLQTVHVGINIKHAIFLLLLGYFYNFITHQKIQAASTFNFIIISSNIRLEATPTQRI